MNTERLLSVGVALAVVVAMSLAAATLGSTMSTDPDDAIDLDYEYLPIGQDRAAAINQEAGSDESGEGGGADDGQEGDVDAGEPSGGGQGATRPSSMDLDERNADSERSDADEPGSAQKLSGEGDQQGTGPGGEDGTGGPGPRQYLLLLLLALLALLVLAALAYRYRERLAALARSVLGAGSVDRADQRATRLVPSPENDVQRAWAELISRAGIDRPHTKTPRETARAAIDAGFDAEGVEQLRRAFEEVRYGERPMTEEHVRTVRDGLRRMEGGNA